VTLVVALVRTGVPGDEPATKAKQPPATAVQQRSVGKKPKPKQTQVYVVRAGDTLTTISAATGVSVARLEQLNPSVEPTSLFIGDKLRLR
jgi:LysM repeat protein